MRVSASQPAHAIPTVTRKRQSHSWILIDPCPGLFPLCVGVAVLHEVLHEINNTKEEVLVIAGCLSPPGFPSPLSVPHTEQCSRRSLGLPPELISSPASPVTPLPTAAGNPSRVAAAPSPPRPTSSPPPEAAAGQARGAKDGGGGASVALPLRGEPRIWSGGSIGKARPASSRAGGGSGVPAARAAGSGGRWRPAAASAAVGARDLAPPLLPCSACGPAWSGRASSWSPVLYRRRCWWRGSSSGEIPGRP